MLLYALQPRLVLEIGTFTGYSAIAIAAALPPDGHIITCELSEGYGRAARNIEAIPYSDATTLELGPALLTIDRLHENFDFVFIEADKANYFIYVEAVLQKLSARGLNVVDDTLWNGYQQFYSR